MPENNNNNIMSLEGQLVGMPLAGPESFSQQQLDYLKRALGVDETVLWEGNGSSNFSLSEPVSNFERVRVVMSVSNVSQTFQNSIHEFSAAGDYLSICDTIRFPANSNYPVYEFRWGASIANGTTITNIYSELYWRAKDSYSGGLNTSVNYYPIKIIGINRVAGGN